MEMKKLKEKRKSFVMREYSAIRNPQSALQGGFTLIEIIVLIVMAGILIPAIVVPFATGVRRSGKPEMVTKAMYYAHQGMEELMKFDFSKTTELDVAVSLPTYKNCLTVPSGPDSNYSCQYQVLYVTNSNLINGFITPTTYYKQIHVRVTDPDGTTYDVYSVVTDFPDWR